jgi:hypothetical protein
MSKKNIPSYIGNDNFSQEYNGSYETRIKEKIFDKLDNLKTNDFLKLNYTQMIYNKYFFNLQLMNEEKKIIDMVLI